MEPHLPPARGKWRQLAYCMGGLQRESKQSPLYPCGPADPGAQNVSVSTDQTRVMLARSQPWNLRDCPEGRWDPDRESLLRMNGYKTEG